MEIHEKAPQWYIYMVRCNDGTLYTGIARDVNKRVREHNRSGEGARYTKSRRPVRLVYTEPSPTRAEAQKREYRIRKMSAREKNRLIMQSGR